MVSLKGKLNKAWGQRACGCRPRDKADGEAHELEKGCERLIFNWIPRRAEDDSAVIKLKASLVDMARAVIDDGYGRLDESPLAWEGRA